MPSFKLQRSPNSPSSLLLRCQHTYIQGASGRYPSMGSRVGQWRWERTGLAVEFVLPEWKNSMFLMLCHGHSDLPFKVKCRDSHLFSATYLLAQHREDDNGAEESIHQPLGLKLVEIHTPWKQGLALEEQPTVLLDTGKACQCKAITNAEGHLGINLAQQPCCLWLTDTQMLLEIEVCMIICGIYLVRCQHLSFTLHKTFWSITHQRYQSQEAHFENKCEESLEKAISRTQPKNPLSWLYQCFKLGLFWPN